MIVSTNIYYNPEGLSHDTGPGHPEQIARLQTILELLKSPPFDKLSVLSCKEQDLTPVLYAHSQEYVDFIAENEPDHGFTEIDGEVVLCPGSFEAALSAANTLCKAVDDVMSDKCQRAFCAVRPPGHHALDNRPMGFCIFDNIFIAAKHAQKNYSLKKILIIDFDVHHGNGTDHLSRKSEGIFFISTHQSPLYPGTGDPKYDEPGKTLNIPLSAGTSSEIFRMTYEKEVFPIIDTYQPEIILISAGFDAHNDDPLANICLSEDDYYWVTEKICHYADKHCGGKVIAALEGGYNLEALNLSVAAHLRALANL